HAWELKKAGLDWRQGVLCRCLQGAALEVAKLKANGAFASEAARVRAFVQSGAGCRATYYHHAKKLHPLAGRPHVPLAHTTPPADAVLPADHLDKLQRRFGSGSGTVVRSSTANAVCSATWARSRPLKYRISLSMVCTPRRSAGSVPRSRRRSAAAGPRLHSQMSILTHVSVARVQHPAFPPTRSPARRP